MANGIVLGGSLRCRKTPASTGAVWGSFSNGTVLTVTNSSDADWYQTTWNGSVGYVMKSFVAAYRCPSRSACRLRRPRRTDNALRTNRALKRPAKRIPHKEQHRG